MVLNPTNQSRIRNRLTALKQNRAEFIKAEDVLNLYHAIVKQGESLSKVLCAYRLVFTLLTLALLLCLTVVTKLNEVREAAQEAHTPNRLDTTLSDVFSLLSLFFLTIGKGRECPATYCQIASMRVCSSPINL
jgi:hypothetical protein